MICVNLGNSRWIGGYSISSFADGMYFLIKRKSFGNYFSMDFKNDDTIDIYVDFKKNLFYVFVNNEKFGNLMQWNQFVRGVYIFGFTSQSKGNIIQLLEYNNQWFE